MQQIKENRRRFALWLPLGINCCDVWQDASRMILTFCNTTPHHSRSFTHSRKVSPLVPSVSTPSLPLSLSRRCSRGTCVATVGVTVCNSVAFVCCRLHRSLPLPILRHISTAKGRYATGREAMEAVNVPSLCGACVRVCMCLT